MKNDQQFLETELLNEQHAREENMATFKAFDEVIYDLIQAYAESPFDSVPCEILSKTLKAWRDTRNAKRKQARENAPKHEPRNINMYDEYLSMGEVANITKYLDKLLTISKKKVADYSVWKKKKATELAKSKDQTDYNRIVSELAVISEYMANKHIQA